MLPLLPLRFELQQQQSLRLPLHAGSMLRGAFGMALKKLACITRQPDCKTCPLYHSCAYTQIFETPTSLLETAQPIQTVHPYVITAPSMGERIIYSGESWSFGMTLIGKAIDQLPLVAYAWQKACEGGFSKTQSSAQLMGIFQGDNCIYTPNSSLKATVLQQVNTPNLQHKATLNFVTPLRLQSKGMIILQPAQITASHLLMILAKRTQRLADLHTHHAPQLDFNALKNAAEKITLQHQLKRDTLTRYSNRQQQLMDLDGLIGSITLEGDLAPFAELLAMGEYVHVGKSATFGLGKYTLENIK